MFSFIKALQNFFSNLKKKKGLWFTTLTVLSIIGISVSMYLLSNMTTSIAKEVYINMSSTYINNLEDKIEDKKNEYKRIILGLQTNDTFKDNLNNKLVIDSILENYNKNLSEMGFGQITLSFYSITNQINQYKNIVNTVISRKTSSFGFEVLGDGPNIVYLFPIIIDSSVVGVVEIKENIISLKNDIERSKQTIFLFLLQEKMMNNLSDDLKNRRYRLVVDGLRVEEQKYDSSLVSNVAEGGQEEIKELKNNGYLVNDVYFKTYKEVVDVNGVTIGYIIMAEKVQGSNGFVNIVDNMTKSVTLVSLGLVISILLFMF
ncbi:hypothetical protein N5T98_00240 [Aliarcobacter cryaerophilus]|uniref:hypothetical protein n=1 Tax=Aliarcobacter TaxID=2321111 RepID=UPI0012FBC844|nr:MULTISPECIES: hypothetical protein [Aliarcobacter]MCT7485314.1 hypothetical protein [Aliarcobacter cryaerophilus]MCT7489516.1 hypothetical protein [Aliarcobacter cryaerophilus]